MKYLKDAIRFLIKNWLIAVPLFVCLAIPALLTNTASSIADFTKVWSSLSDPSQLTNLSQFFTLAGIILPAAVGGGILSFVFQFVSMPATYGLVNNGLDTGKSDLNQIGQAISTNFVKYVMYFVGMLLIGLALGIVSLILMLIFIVTRSIPLMVLFFVIIGIAAIIISVLLSLWFSAMVVDNLDVFAAAKKSIEIVRSCFWTVVGILLLVTISGNIVSAIFSFLHYIPLLGPIILSAVPTATTSILIVFYMLLYREKTGKYNFAPIA